MKVVLKKTVIEKIIEADTDAKKENRQVDYIELSLPEAEELRRDMNLYPRHARPGFMGLVMGIRVFVVEEDF